MNKILLSLLIFAGFFTINAQIPSNCDVSPVLRTYYEPDVKDMALKWLFAIKSPDTVLIDIPQWCQDTVWKGLGALFNRCDLPEVDSVFNKYCVHTSLRYETISIHEVISVHLDTSYSWTKNWLNLQTITGIPALDSLLAKYGFSVKNASSWTHPPKVYLFTNQLINVLPLCDSLESFPGIIWSLPNAKAIPDHPVNRISFSDTGNAKYYSFKFFWSDWGCPLGCIYTWKYKVNPDCSIEFPGNEGSPGGTFPEPGNCNILTIPPLSFSNNDVEIYPNPTTRMLTIALPGNLSHEYLSILDINGRELIKQTIFDQITQLDIGNLQNGIYFAKIINENKIYIKKIIKQ